MDRRTAPEDHGGVDSAPDRALEIPPLESWAELKHFAEAMRVTGKYGGVLNNISSTSTMPKGMLAYYRGNLHGLWLKQLTDAEKRNILKHYTILRLER